MISRSKDDLGKLLVDEQLITTRQLDKAHTQSERTGEPLQKVLISLNFVTEKDVVEAMGRQMGVRFVDLESQNMDPELARLIPEHLAQRYKVIPVGQQDNRLTLAMVDPLNVIALDDIRLITGFDIDPVIATEDSITKALNGQFGVTAIAEVEGTVKDISATDFGPMDFDDASDEEGDRAKGSIMSIVQRHGGEAPARRSRRSHTSGSSIPPTARRSSSRPRCRI